MEIQCKLQKKINIVIADDHPVICLGLKKVIEQFKNICVIAVAHTIGELFELLSKNPCDVVICDYSFDGDKEPDGVLLIERLNTIYPNVKIVLLTAYDDLALVRRVMNAGATGFISKASADFASLPKVLELVLSGEQYIDQKTSKKIFDHVIHSDLVTHKSSNINLSTREFEVLRLFSRGISLTEIAGLTGRSIKTISAQKINAMTKLGVKNDVELISTFKKTN